MKYMFLLAVVVVVLPVVTHANIEKRFDWGGFLESVAEVFHEVVESAESAGLVKRTLEHSLNAHCVSEMCPALLKHVSHVNLIPYLNSTDFCEPVCKLANLAIGLVQSASACRDGLVPFGGSCYYFSHDLENWMNAEEMCKVMFEGILAEVDDASENAFINHHVNAGRASRYWLGATDVVKEGDWVWTTTQQKVTGPSYVDFRESNNKGNENCMEVMKGNVWNDNACSFSSNYICEVSAETGFEVIG